MGDKTASWETPVVMINLLLSVFIFSNVVSD